MLYFNYIILLLGKLLLPQGSNYIGKGIGLAAREKVRGIFGSEEMELL